MLDFIHAILSRDEAVVDSILVTTGVSVLALIGLTIYATIEFPANYSPIAFATGLGTLIGCLGAAKRLRDGCSPQRGDGDAH